MSKQESISTPAFALICSGLMGIAWLVNKALLTRRRNLERLRAEGKDPTR